MKYTLALLSLLGAAAAQGVIEDIAPDGSYPEGCTKDFDGTIEVAPVKVVEKRGLMPQRRGECGKEGILVMTLQNGVLKDAKDRTGYIAANYQFQFDKPAQTGAIYTAGYSVCGNGSVALGSSTTFFSCASGGFSNLYDRNWAEQCEPVQLIAMPCGGSDSGAGQIGDGQVVATNTITTTVVKPISDGQPQVITTVVPVPMCQIGDGQVQVHTTPCASITNAPAPAPTATAPVISQLTDGQPQVPTGTPLPPPPATTAVSLPGETPAPSTLETSASVSAPVSSAASPAPPPAATTSAPAQAGVGRVEMGSVAGLLVGIVAALAFL